jgi:hypothetical protein
MNQRTLARVLISAALLPSTLWAVPSHEAVKAGADSAFLRSNASDLRPALPKTLDPLSGAVSEPVLQDPKAAPADPFSILGEVGRVALSSILDKQRDVMTRQLGASTWDIGPAGDPGFKSYFLTFRQAAKLVIAPLGDLNRLRGEGINVRIDERTVYNIKVSPNIFDPVRGSKLILTPVQGTQGPKHETKTGPVMDAVKARSYIFKSGGKEYWVMHGTDVDPATNTLGQTRSLLFVHEAGLSSKAWPMAESALEVGKPTAVDFEGNKLVLTRTADGQLVINAGR